MLTRRYTAFLAYRHADNTLEGRRWADWLHRSLERYIIPPDLIGTPNLRGEPIRDSLYPIFRDEDELPANADLGSSIRTALQLSDHLIVLCSPRSAISPWVRREVREFKERGRSDRILAIIIAGEPNADDPAKAREGITLDEECFCEELRFGATGGEGTLDWTLRTEPVAADLRPSGSRTEGFVSAEAYREHLTLNSSHTMEQIAALTENYRQQLDRVLLKVVAGLIGVSLGRLVDRDAAYRAELLGTEAAVRALAEAKAAAGARKEAQAEIQAVHAKLAEVESKLAKAEAALKFRQHRELVRGVFISYRREDTKHAAGRLCDSLIERFGRKLVFFDVDSLHGGDHFPTILEQALSQSRVMLVVIGPHWLSNRRLFEAGDFVRQEVEGALEHKLAIVPILLDGTQLPQAKELPDSIKKVCESNALPLRHESWPHDSKQIVNAVASHLPLKWWERLLRNT